MYIYTEDDDRWMRAERAERERIQDVSDKIQKARTEVAREIFEEVDSLLDLACHMIGIEILSFPQYTELKKKYMEGKK